MRLLEDVVFMTKHWHSINQRISGSDFFQQNDGYEVLWHVMRCFLRCYEQLSIKGIFKDRGVVKPPCRCQWCVQGIHLPGCGASQRADRRFHQRTWRKNNLQWATNIGEDCAPMADSQNWGSKFLVGHEREKPPGLTWMKNLVQKINLSIFQPENESPNISKHFLCLYHSGWMCHVSSAWASPQRQLWHLGSTTTTGWLPWAPNIGDFRGIIPLPQDPFHLDRSNGQMRRWDRFKDCFLPI